jgi:predicted acetyltransferase
MGDLRHAIVQMQLVISSNIYNKDGNKNADNEKLKLKNSKNKKNAKIKKNEKHDSMKNENENLKLNEVEDLYPNHRLVERRDGAYSSLHCVAKLSKAKLGNICDIHI